MTAGSVHAPDREGPESTPLTWRRRILLHCPDITLKGRNQADFQRALERNIRHCLQVSACNWNLGSSRGKVCIDVPGDETGRAPEMLGRLCELPGVSTAGLAHWLHPGKVADPVTGMNWRLLEQAMVEIANASYSPGLAFAIRCNRVHKGLPATSKEIGQRLGEAVRTGTGWDAVNLSQPDQTFHVDAYPDGLYLYADKHHGPGGLPVGTGGRVLGLLSGGIDSPVAAFAMAKRGCTVDLFHMSASHVGARELAGSLIGRLARRLSRYTRRSRLYVAPYTYFDLAVGGRNTGYELVLFRRFLMRAAEQMARRVHAQALVNGDSLGQVASQTLENLVSSTRAVEIPILRPLIGSNKEEIITVARRIGTYEISIEPYKDCCALIARNPRTRSRHDSLTRMEEELLPDYAHLIETTLADVVRLDFDSGELRTAETGD